METDNESYWQSPLTGAYLLWRFVRGFCSQDEKGVNVILAYPALALAISDEFSRDVMQSSSVADFAYSFHDSAGRRVRSLAGLQERIANLKGWVLKSIEFACVTRLIELDPATARLKLVLQEENPESADLANCYKKKEGLVAEKVGALFAREDASKIGYYLGVQF